jgi:uncharacterized Zn finger protein (UPF0148 family)
MAEAASKFPCPHCLAPVHVPEPGQGVICPVCGVGIDIIGRLCAHCFHYHEQVESICPDCLEPMTHVCRQCDTVNWDGDLVCRHCGAGLDVIETLPSHSTEGTTAFAQRQMREARQLKEKESLDSEQRMEKMTKKEEARQQELRRREAIVKARERRMLQVTLVALGTTILLLIIITLLTS